MVKILFFKIKNNKILYTKFYEKYLKKKSKSEISESYTERKNIFFSTNFDYLVVLTWKKLWGQFKIFYFSSNK